MTRSIPVGEVRPLGDRAFLIGVADAAAGRVLARALDVSLAGAAEVVCGAGTVMVGATDPDADLRPVRPRWARCSPRGPVARPTTRSRRVAW